MQNFQLITYKYNRKNWLQYYYTTDIVVLEVQVELTSQHSVPRNTISDIRQNELC